MAFSPPSLAASQHLDRPFLFQPPKSPASVTLTPLFATGSNEYFSAATGSKKRQRPGSSHDHHATNTPTWAQCPTPSDKLFESGYGQNSELVNEKYILAGGFDTPTLQTTTRLEQLTVPEYEFRRRLRDHDMGGNVLGDCPPLSGPLARERNGVARMPSSQNEVSQPTWTGLAVRLVGKVFNFGSNVVRGFYAGGGQGYEMKECALVGSDLLQEGINRCSTPVPGAWQDDEFLGDFEQDSPAFGDRSPTARPPNKRRQTDRDTWVLVGTPDHETINSSPKRKVSRDSVPRSNLTQRPSASRASSRRSIAPVPRRAHSNMVSNGSPPQFPVPPPQQPSHSRRASFASPRSPQGRPSMSGQGMMSPEAERYAKRQAKQDRAADKAISSMGRRMEEMIRQAQEALGTKVSVEGDMEVEDEGFVDDDW